MKQFFLATSVLLFSIPAGFAATYHAEERQRSLLSPLILPVGQPDNSLTLNKIDTVPSAVERHKIVPRRATIRSLIIPGWGQFYNRQYWKVPLIYTSLGVAVSIFTWNQHRYSQYLAGYREAYGSTTINPVVGAKTAVVRGEVHSVAYLKQATDQFRRQRDLTVIFTVVGWALNAVEANVAAHLKTFDVSDDLTMQITPAVLPAPELGFVPGIRIALRCK